VKLETYHINESLAYPVIIGYELWPEMDTFLKPFMKSGRLFILTDDNTRNYCLPVLINHLPVLALQAVFNISPGEQSKDISSLERIWQWLMKAGATKDSLLINLGGGVVSDIGGFAAATYKRGMRYINVPTSLMGQVDAGIGGKTGINIAGVKNQAGLIYNPSAVFINPVFLATLPGAHRTSGFAEIIKNAALSGGGFWEQLKNMVYHEQDLFFDILLKAVTFKCSIVADDLFDLSTRKMLNFGHTVGHAIESFSYEQGTTGWMHGEAVAAGMVCEAYLSHLTSGLPKSEMEEITAVISTFFNLKPLESRSYDKILHLIDHDKKKTTPGIGFSLLENLGKPCLERSVDRQDIIRSLEYYNQIFKK
jgi:3-dehydroquinate synthase